MPAPLLLVDDDLATIAQVKRLLARDGYEVVLATNAADAIIAWGHHLPKLVLISPRVESDRGRVVLEELRQHPEARLLHVLLLGETIAGFGYPVAPLPLDPDSFSQLVSELVQGTTASEGWQVHVAPSTRTDEYPAVTPPGDETEPDTWRATRKGVAAADEKTALFTTPDAGTPAVTDDAPPPPLEPTVTTGVPTAIYGAASVPEEPEAEPPPPALSPPSAELETSLFGDLEAQVAQEVEAEAMASVDANLARMPVDHELQELEDDVRAEAARRREKRLTASMPAVGLPTPDRAPAAEAHDEDGFESFDEPSQAEPEAPVPPRESEDEVAARLGADAQKAKDLLARAEQIAATATAAAAASVAAEHSAEEDRARAQSEARQLWAEVERLESEVKDVQAELETRTEELAAKQAELEQRDAELGQQGSGLAAKDAELAAKDAALVEKDAALAEKDAALAEKDAALAEKDAALAEKDAALAEKDAALAEKDVALAGKGEELAAKEAELAAKDSELATRDAELSEKTAALALRDAELAERGSGLQTRDAELAEVRAQLSEQSEAAAARAAELEAAAESVAARLAQARASNTELEGQVQAEQRARAALEDRLAALTAQTDELSAAAQRAAGELREAVEEAEQSEARAQAQAGEIDALRARNAESEAGLEQLRAEVEKLQQDFTAAHAVQRNLQEALEDAKAANLDIRTRAEQAEAKVRVLEEKSVMPLKVPHRPPLAVAKFGTVELGDLARLVGQIVLARAELRLELAASGGRRTIWLSRGAIIAAESTFGGESLLDRARRDGLIDARQTAELQMLRSATPAETVAVLKERGFLRDAEAVPLVQRYTEQVALDAFSEPTSDYRLAEEAPGNETLAATLPRPTLPLVAEALRRALPVEELLHRLGGSEAVPSTLESALDLRALGFADKERRMLGYVDGEANVEDLALASGLKADVAFRAMLVAKLLGLIALTVPARTQVAPAAQLDVKRLDAKFEQVQDADYFTMLGLGRAAGGDEVLRAWQRLSEEFDPLKYSGHPDAGLQQRAQVVYSVLEEAAKALGDDRRRAEYARHLVD